MLVRFEPVSILATQRTDHFLAVLDSKITSVVYPSSSTMY